MQSGISRFTQVGDWIFEVKMVRALRVSEYGQPYSAIATLTSNGDNIYIDSQMTRQEDDFNRGDFMAFYEFCRQMEIKQVHYDKVRSGSRQPRVVTIQENSQEVARPNIRLVK